MNGSDDVLDLIDTAVNDWTVSPDAMRVTRGHARLAVDRALWDERTRAIRQVFRDFGEVVNAAAAQLCDVAILLQPSSPAEPSPVEPSCPTDPRERALYLRQTRNTGPAQRQRAPRRINARGR